MHDAVYKGQRARRALRGVPWEELIKQCSAASVKHRCDARECFRHSTHQKRAASDHARHGVYGAMMKKGRMTDAEEICGIGDVRSLARGSSEEQLRVGSPSASWFGEDLCRSTSTACAPASGSSVASTLWMLERGDKSTDGLPYDTSDVQFLCNNLALQQHLVWKRRRLCNARTTCSCPRSSLPNAQPRRSSHMPASEHTVRPRPCARTIALGWRSPCL